jgi:hypothetical protein
MADPAAILRAFADLAPAGRRVTYDVAGRDEPFVWLGTRAYPMGDARAAWDRPHPGHDVFSQVVNSLVGPDSARRPAEADGAALRRLAAIDALYPQERLVREGWVFLCGRATVDGRSEQLCLPLLSRPVRLHDAAGVPLPLPAGDRELTTLIRDPATSMRLEETAEFGGGALGGEDASAALIARLPQLNQWIAEVVAAAGLPAAHVLPPSEHPVAHRADAHLVAVVGSGVYLARDPGAPDLTSSLRNWAAADGLETSAFARVYADVGAPAAAERAERLRSPLPLSRVQRAVVLASRTEPVTVVSGPPGTGKTHTLAALAIDAVARGESVLVATMSDHATDALTDLLRRQPGPIPVLFGNAEQRESVATQLAAGLGAPRPAAELQRMYDAVRVAVGRVDQLEAIIGERLLAELLAGDALRFEALAAVVRDQVPGAFAPDVDLEDLAAERAVLARPAGGRIARWRQRRRRHRFLRRLGAVEQLDDATLDEALAVARARRSAALLEVQGGTRLAALWAELQHVDSTLASTAGSYVDELSRSLGASSGPGRRAVSGLATALRAGRGRRRAHLQSVDARSLVAALPLWVGTLRDIDDLLPAVPAMFDVVILDESSQIDQVRAAPGLLRGRRAVIAGDPYQLRHVTFLADAEVKGTLDRHGLGTLEDRLDLRRNSIFDASLAVAPVRWLDQHYRSVPHLIEFSADHFYGDRIRLMTRHPRNEQLDAIDVVRVDGARGEDGANPAEVEAVERIVRELAASGATSIGVVSPFRGQADALEAMLVDAFPPAEIRRLGLRVGTVHTFQGNERDVVVMSLALAETDGARSRRFVEDPNLFNVLVTRARQHAIVVTSLDQPQGLIGDYLRHADHPPGPAGEGTAASPWVAALAEELARNGLHARPGYPVGGWLVDLCVGDGAGATALECGLHPEGVAAHIDRHRELVRAGWRLVDGYPSRWAHDPVRAALELLSELTPPAG